METIPPPGVPAPVKLGTMATQAASDVDIQGGRIVRLREFQAFKADVKELVVGALTATTATIGAISAITLTLSTALYLPDGSAALPGAAFELEKSTGVYRPADGSIGVSVLGTEVVRLTAAGLGVGAQAPLYKAHIVGASAAYAGGTTGILTIATGTGASTDEELRFGIVNGSYAWVQALKLGTAYRSLVLQHSGGNVGILATSPATKLHVQGASTSTTATGAGTLTGDRYYAGGTMLTVDNNSATAGAFSGIHLSTLAASTSRQSVSIVAISSASGFAPDLVIAHRTATDTMTERVRLKPTGELVCNPSYINVRQYGATGDGTTDDTTAISNALTDAASNAMRRVYFPQGTYRTTSALVISGDFHLFGDGPNTSVIKVDHTGNGITYTGTTTASENQKLEVVGLGFRSNSSTADSAIDCTWTLSGGGTYPAWPSLLIQDVEIGNASTTTSFQYGIKANGANHSLISNLNCFALESGTISANSYGLHLTSCVDTRIQSCTFHYIETGVYGVDTEGLHFAGNVFLSCLDGIKIETTLTSGKPGLYITQNHMNVGRYGIHVIEQVQFFIGDNLIYGDQRTPTAGTTFMGVRIESGSNASGVQTQSIVRDNIVVMVDESVSGYTTANYGYAVYGGSGTVESILFQGNKSQACDVLIYLDSSSTKVVILDDNIGTSGETWSNNGTANSIPYGVYTPTPYAVTNITLDTDIDTYEAMWTRTGDEVTVYGDVDIDPVAVGGTTFRLSLPPDCVTDQSAATKLSGILSSPSGANGPGGTFQMHTATSPDRAECNYYAASTGISRHSYSFRFRVAA